MKKLVVLLLFLSIFFSSVLAVNAAETTSSESAVATSSSKTIDYTFVYPGILPDNPLYFLKAIRDRVVSLLISDRLKRAEFDLLASDKRLVAAAALARNNKDELATTTFSKSNNYMDQVITNLSAAKKMGQNIDTVLHNAQTAIKKHKEEISKVKKSINKDFAPAFSAEAERLEKLENAASKIKPK